MARFVQTSRQCKERKERDSGKSPVEKRASLFLSLSPFLPVSPSKLNSLLPRVNRARANITFRSRAVTRSEECALLRIQR